MEIKIYKTQDIRNEIWDQIVSGFNVSFNGVEVDKSTLFTNFISNHFGYSYHSVCMEGGKLIGFTSVLPNYYIHNNEKLKIGLSGSTYVLNEYRKDIFIFYDMYEALKHYCKNDGVFAIVGIPNANSYQYLLKILNFKEVFQLRYYILPIKISKLLGFNKSHILDIFSYLFSFILIMLNNIVSIVYKAYSDDYAYKLETNADYLKKRFSDPRYKTIRKGNIIFTYVIAHEDNIKTAYIMDFSENFYKSYRSLLSAVNHIIMHERVDVVLFVGNLRLSQGVLLKVPRKYEPKRLPFTYNILDVSNEKAYEDMNNQGSWDFSLINLDVR